MALFKFSAILEGRPIDVYNYGQMLRDFTYVKDLVHAIGLLIDTVPDGTETRVEGDSLSPVAPFEWSISAIPPKYGLRISLTQSRRRLARLQSETIRTCSLAICPQREPIAPCCSASPTIDRLPTCAKGSDNLWNGTAVSTRYKQHAHRSHW